jgi:cytochrome c-type biogenesis protein CcmH/NrfG
VGQAYAEQGEYGDAATSFEQALALKPDYVDAYLDLGTVRRLQGDAPRALGA